MLGQRELFKTRLSNKIEVELREPCKQRLAEAGENRVASRALDSSAIEHREPPVAARRPLTCPIYRPRGLGASLELRCGFRRSRVFVLGLARNGRQRASLRVANENAVEREPGGINSECDAA